MRRLLAAAVAAVLALAGCAGPERNPDLGRPLAVLTSLQFTTSDPAYANDEGSDTVAYNVFQRVLSMEPGTTAPRPDSGECKFIDAVTYTCLMRKGLRFRNGDPLTAEDVRFSIERAHRLAKPGMPGKLFDNVTKIEVKGDRRIDFTLAAPDNTFVYALASPAGSIVNRKFYPPDGPRTGFDPPMGSGPFVLMYQDLDQLRLVRNPSFAGTIWPYPEAVTIHSTGDPAVAERLMATDRIDVLWGARPPGGVPPTFATETFAHSERSRLLWNPDSPRRGDAAVRAFVRDATAPLRTQTSNVPAPLEPQAGEFPRDARATPPAGGAELTLGYPGRDQRAVDLAAAVRGELEKAPGVRVRLVPDDRAADLWLTFDRPSTAALLPTLQHWTDFPLPGREPRIAELVAAYRRTTAEHDRQAAATALLREAAADATLVPLTQGDLTVPVRRGMKINQEYKSYAGPNGQLGAWELRW